MASEKVVMITKDNFDGEVLKAEMPVLVDFWAKWCGPCMAIGPVIDELSEEYEGKAKICKVNVDNEPELARKFRVMSIPTIIIFKNGEIADKLLGSRSKGEFQELLNKHI